MYIKPVCWVGLAAFPKHTLSFRIEDACLAPSTHISRASENVPAKVAMITPDSIFICIYGVHGLRAVRLLQDTSLSFSLALTFQ